MNVIWRNLIITLCVLSILPACQKAGQSTLAPSNNNQPIETGGGDSGGGGVIRKNGQLRLKDFENCTDLKLTFTQPHFEPITQNIHQASVKNAIEPLIQSQPQILKDLVSISISNSLWYFVNKDLKWLGAKYGETTIAIYKRPTGILVNNKIYNELPPQDQMGLLLHEALRMMSIGFGLNISTEKIEEMVCKIASQKSINTAEYFDPQDFFKKQYNHHVQNPEEVIHSMVKPLEQNSINVGTPIVLNQKFHSKFNHFRNYLKTSDAVLDEVFFKWMVKEAPQSCDSFDTCNFSEVWPNSNDSFKEWNLFLKNDEWIGWNSQNYFFISSQEEMKSEDASQACKEFSTKFNLDFKVFSKDDLSEMKIHFLNLAVTDRNNLDYVLDTVGFPFLGQDNQKTFLWSPNGFEGEYIVQNSDWDGTGRALCIAKTPNR